MSLKIVSAVNKLLQKNGLALHHVAVLGMLPAIEVGAKPSQRPLTTLAALAKDNPLTNKPTIYRALVALERAGVAERKKPGNLFSTGWRLTTVGQKLVNEIEAAQP